MKRKTAVFLDCLKQFVIPLFVYIVNVVLIFVVFSLYELSLEPFFYVIAVSLFFLICAFVFKFIKESKNAEIREQQLNNILCDWNNFPQTQNLSTADFIQMIKKLGEELERITADFSDAQKETQDFYTTWVHQIKTPIAVMKLELGKANNFDASALQEELFRIEQYTDMVLAYQRLGSSSTDLVIKEYLLDDLIREVIRKFASQFIYKKLKLDYDGCEERIFTDKKWFCLILEQLVSNAIKYTKAGTVSIKMSEGILSVSDTGIGIAPEDLPRIFEKGYTGANGRLNEKSSGLGLYLCTKAASLLNIKIQVRSEIGKGSSFSLQFPKEIHFIW